LLLLGDLGAEDRYREAVEQPERYRFTERTHAVAGPAGMGVGPKRQ
jgi:hypothetical protein